jgi:pimeloyl-ACP methyl ester carboxylesterase
MVEELHTLLKNSNTPGPYVLVGHSFGGANARLYASTYPDDVAGIVLVDASHEDQLEKIPQFPEQTWLKVLKMFPRFLTSTGIVRLLNHMHSVPNDPNNPYDNEALKLAKRSTTKYIVTTMQEYKGFAESLNELKASGGMLDNKPLTVITAGKELTGNGGGYSKQFVDEYNAAWQALQKDLVTKSTRGKQIIIKNSGHDIPREQPQVIVDAVCEMVKSI